MEKQHSMKISLIVILSSLTIVSFGQSNILDIGVEGGLSSASLRGNDYINKYHSSRIGYSGGLFVQYNLKKTISFRSGCYYELKGSSLEYQVIDYNGQQIGAIQGKENFDYLTIPLLIRATLGKKIHYFFNVGPYYSLLQKQTVHTESFQDYLETTINQTNNFKKIEIGISCGFGLSYILINKYAFSFEARNNLGITNTWNFSEANDGVIKTNALIFLFGFSYKFLQRKHND